MVLNDMLDVGAKSDLAALTVILLGLLIKSVYKGFVICKDSEFWKRTIMKLANNSLSYALYFFSVGVSLGEKKASGLGIPPTICSKIPPIPVTEALMYK